MKCEMCEVNEVGAWQDYCDNCEYEIREVEAQQDYRTWIMTHEFHADIEASLYNTATSYHTCIRCGEMLAGVNASVKHWEKRHKTKLFPDGFTYEVVAG